MKRREFVGWLAGAAAWALPASAQQSSFRIGVLETTSENVNSANLSGFKAGMLALGYREGTNFTIEYRSAEGIGERFIGLAEDLVKLGVHVIVTRGTPAVLAAKKATQVIPIVMAAVGEPLMIVPSLAKPGGNVTGLSGYSTDLEAKRVEVLKEAVPGIKHLAGLYNMGNPVVPAQWKKIQNSAEALDTKTQLLDVRTPDDIVAAFQTAVDQRADALMVGIDALTQEYSHLVANLTVKRRLPAMFVSREWVEAGGLLAYGPSYPDLYRRAASYVDRVLKGAVPGDLPIEQPAKFELIVNLKTAKSLGLTIPPSLLARAGEVIE